MKSSQSVKNKKRHVPVAIVHINATFNNTIVTVTDQQGYVIAWSSAGANGFKNSRKSTPYAGQVAAEKALEKVMTDGVRTLSIKVRGPGSAREAAARAVAAVAAKHSVTVTSIQDVTPIAHNGCRPRKARRM